jgi:hypothetical protein
MNSAFLVVGSFILGAIVDHFLEVRSIATVKKAIKESEDRILAAMRKEEKSKSASASD